MLFVGLAPAQDSLPSRTGHNEAQTVQLEVLVPLVKGGKRIGFAPKGTRALLLGPIDEPDADLDVVAKGLDIGGKVRFEVQRSRPYRLVIDTAVHETDPSSLYLPTSVAIVYEGDKPNYAIAAPVRYVKDFSTPEYAAHEMKLVLSALDGGTDSEVASLKEGLNALRISILSGTYQLAKTVPLDAWKSEIYGPKTRIKGFAGYQEWGGDSAGVYKHRQLWAFTADGKDILPLLRSQRGSVDATSSFGNFELELPIGLQVTIVVDSMLTMQTGDSLPMWEMVSICPVSSEQETSSVCIFRESGENRYLANESRLDQIQFLLSRAKDIATDEAAKDRARQANHRLRSARSAESRINIVASLYGDRPRDSWEELYKASQENKRTVFWVIAKPDGYIPNAKWKNDFEPYLTAQYRESPLDTSAAALPRTNFRVLAYVSLIGEGNAPKPKAAIWQEVMEWTSDQKRAVTGLFIDNLWQYSEDELKQLVEQLKTEFGEDFTIFGSCGPRLRADDEVVSAEIVDVLFLAKRNDVDFREIRKRSVRIKAMHPNAKLAVISLGVQKSRLSKLMRDNQDAGVTFVGLSDQMPQNEMQKRYDASIAVPDYWPDFCELCERINQK